MRYVLARLLCTAAVAAVWIWSSPSSTEAAELRVATFRCDVSPPLGQAIYATYKPLEVIEHPLLAKGIVLEDAGRRYVLCAIDWCELQDSSHLMFRRKMAQAAGADPARVAVHTVHQHTAPMVNGDVSRLLAHVENPPSYPEEKYFEKVADQVAAAVKESLGRLQAFDRIGSGEGKVQRVASNRRIIDKDGKLHSRWSVVTGKDLPLRDEPEGLIDPMLKTITLAQGDKSLVRLHFYACHPQSFYHDPRASYDFPGMAREALEKEEGVFQVYFTGCSGDVLVGKYNDGTRAARQQFAERLLAGMKAAIAATRLVAAEKIQWRTAELSLPLYAPAGHTMAENRAAMADTTLEAEARIGAAMRISFAARIARPVALGSLQIGRIHILDLPGECFVTYQLFAQRSAPGDFVAVAAYSDAGMGYVCTDKALEEGGYEPNSTNVGPGTEALLKAAIIKLLGVKEDHYSAAQPAIASLTDLPILVDDKEGEGKVAPDKEKDAWLWVNRVPSWLNLKDVTLGGKVCKTWLLMVHGSLSWTYALHGEYCSLVADLAQYDGTKAHLHVFGDGKQLYDSGYLPPVSHPITAMVDLRGVKTLKISVADVEDGIPWNDKVFLGNPVLIERTLPAAASTAGRAGSTPPVAKIAASPIRGPSPLEVKFRGDLSKAPAGQVGRYTWSFGDGETETLAPNPGHQYAHAGVYEVVLQAEDDRGGIGVARELITVLPSERQPPIALGRATPLAVRCREDVKFDASDSSSTDGTALTFHWDFGDGRKGEGKNVSHAFQSPARYQVILTVSTAGKQQASTVLSIKVNGNPPSPVFPLQKGARVLIIGNSLVGFSGPLDEWLMFFDRISPQPLGLQTASRGKGLGKLVEYATWRKLAVHEKINQGWDVVIIQPWIDAIDDKVSDEDLLRDAKTLVDWVKQSGAYPVLYEPQLGWRDMEKNQEKGHQRIRRLAEVLDTGFIPAGQAWLKVAKVYPAKKDKSGNPTMGDSPAFLHPYMYSDFGHQSFNGSLLNSLMIWKYLTGQSPVTVKVAADAPTLNKEAKQRIVWDRAAYLQRIADESITPASEKVR